MRSLCSLLLPLALWALPAHADIVEGRPDGEAIAWASRLPLGRARAVDVAIIRGRITIEAAEGSVVTLDARSSGPAADAAAVVLQLDRTRDGIAIRDRFPPRTPVAVDFRECLPPDDGRGDWRGRGARIDLLVRVPAGTPVFAHVMDGIVIDRRPTP